MIIELRSLQMCENNNYTTAIRINKGDYDQQLLTKVSYLVLLQVSIFLGKTIKRKTWKRPVY